MDRKPGKQRESVRIFVPTQAYTLSLYLQGFLYTLYRYDIYLFSLISPLGSRILLQTLCCSDIYDNQPSFGEKLNELNLGITDPNIRRPF